VFLSLVDCAEKFASARWKPE